MSRWEAERKHRGPRLALKHSHVSESLPLFVAQLIDALDFPSTSPLLAAREHSSLCCRCIFERAERFPKVIFMFRWSLQTSIDFATLVTDSVLSFTSTE